LRIYVTCDGMNKGLHTPMISIKWDALNQKRMKKMDVENTKPVKGA